MAPQRQWFGHPKFDLNLQMVMQVLPDTGQICRHVDFVLSQGIGWANPTEHHQMWRADGTGRQNNSFGTDQLDITTVRQFDADDLCTVCAQAQNLLVGHNG